MVFHAPAVHAQAAIQSQDAPVALSVTTPGDQSVRVPALTPVSLRIGQDLGSKVSKSGDMFPFTLAEPVLVDGHELLSAGTPGMGEVIHAKKGGFAGAAGELVLTARYLQVGERHLPLRSLTFPAVARDNIGLASAVGIAAGFPALFISGGNVQVPSGTVVMAKTREDFLVQSVSAEMLTGEAGLEEGVKYEN